jgi:hypothetical protein
MRALFVNLRVRLLPVIVLMTSVTTLAAPASGQVANKACPPGTLLFGFGGEAGCIDPDTKKTVVKCFHQKTCPSGWRDSGLLDERGLRLCCMRPPEPVFGTTPEFTFRACLWFGKAPFCNGKCPPGWDLGVGVASRRDPRWGVFADKFGAPCITGFKVLCCQSTLPRRTR